MGLRKGENRFRQYDSAYLTQAYGEEVQVKTKIYKEEEKVSAFDGFEEGIRSFFGVKSQAATDKLTFN